MKKKWSDFIYISKKINSMNRKSIAMQLLYGIFTGLYFTVGLYFPKWIIHEMTGQRREKTVISIIVFMVLSVCLVKFLTMLIEIINSDYNSRTISMLKAEVGSKKMKMEYWRVEDSDELDIQERASVAAARLMKLCTNIYSGLTSSVIQAVVTFTFLYSVHIVIVIILLLNMMLSSFINKKFAPFYYKFDTKTVKEERGMRYIWNTATDVKTAKPIRVFQMKEYLLCKLNNFYQVILLNQKDKQKTIRLQRVLIKIVDLFQVAIVYIFLAIQFRNGNVSIGDFFVALPMTTVFVNAVNDLLQVYITADTMGHFVDDFKHFVEPEENHTSEKWIPMPDQVDTIEFCHVSFSYPKSSIEVLHDINIKLLKKQKIIIVGENGSGKTTFIKLLLRFYLPTKGEIKVNGIPIHKIKREDYLRCFTAVFQDFQIFEYSIRENICFDEKKTEDEIFKLLNATGMKNQIMGLKEGLDTNVYKQLEENGKEFSGGEMQKIAMCRALNKPAEIGLLDEPTASLDPISEHNLFENYKHAVEEQTTLFISHRLSIAQMCDTILVFDDGNLIEQGNHQELLKKIGKYAEMYYIQAKLYKGASKELGFGKL